MRSREPREPNMKPFTPILRAPVSLLAIILCCGSVLSAEAPKDWSGTPARPTAAWVRRSVVYELFPRQFSATGDFAGITARLDELKDLGVDILWLMPIHPVGRLKAKGTVGSPYAVKDYYAINPDYGTKEDLRTLVNAAHARGLKVIIDIVANHTAWDSVMISNPGYYKRDAAGNIIPPHPEWADVAGLNYGSPETRAYMREMLKYWIRDFGLDGYRCDVAGDVPTDFWEDVRQDLDKIRPGLFLLAEASKPELLANAFDADYGWPMLATLNKVLMEGAPASEIRRTWEVSERQAFPSGALHMHCSDDHDESRAISRYGWNAALAASAMMFTMDGLPLIYNGMEAGDTSESSDPALFEKLPVFWHPKGRESFRGVYRQLTALRHEHPALTEGSLEWLDNSSPGNIVSFLRRGEGEELVTLVNLSNRPQSASIRVEKGAEFTLLLESVPRGVSAKAALPDADLGAFGWRLYRRALVP